MTGTHFERITGASTSASGALTDTAHSKVLEAVLREDARIEARQARVAALQLVGEADNLPDALVCAQPGNDACESSMGGLHDAAVHLTLQPGEQRGRRLGGEVVERLRHLRRHAILVGGAGHEHGYVAGDAPRVCFKGVGKLQAWRGRIGGQAAV